MSVTTAFPHFSVYQASVSRFKAVNMELTWIDPEHGSKPCSDGVEAVCVCHIHGKQCVVVGHSSKTVCSSKSFVSTSASNSSYPLRCGVNCQKSTDSS